MKIIEDQTKSNRKLILAVFWVCAIALFGAIQTADAKEHTAINRPVVNPYLASSLYATPILTLPRVTLHPTGLLAVFSM